MKPTTGQGINAGAMREQVTIQSRTSVQDGAGEPLDTWYPFLIARAEIMRLPGAEIFAAEQRAARVPTMFKLRYVDGVQPKMRLLCRGQLYNVLSAIDPDGRRTELHIRAEELVEQPP